MWTSLAYKTLRYRVPILIVIGIATLFMAYQAQKVEMSYEYASLLPNDDAVFIQNQQFDQDFHKIDNVLIIGIQEEHFLDSAFYFKWKNYCQSLSKIKGVSGMISATYAYNLTRNDELKHFEIQKIFTDSIATQAQLDSSKQLLYSLPFYKNRFYNPQTHAWLMAVTLDQKIIFSKNRTQLIQSIEELSHQFTQKTGKPIYLSGLTYIRVTMAKMLENELKMFVILALLITTFILALFFRSFKVVFFTMLVVLIAVIWALGFMAIFGFKITMITGMIPPLLIVIGVPNSIFLVNKYLQSYTKTKDKLFSLARAISKVGNATFLTNLTTSLGFATFITTRSPILVEFGELAFVCIMCLYFLGILLIPIIFSYSTPPKTRHTKHLQNKRIQSILSFLIFAVVNKRRYIYLGTLVIVIAGFFGIQKIYVSGYMVDDIPQSNHLIKDLTFFENNFRGIMPLDITIDTKRKQGVFDLNNLKYVNQFQDKLANWDKISMPLSIVEFVKFARQSYYRGQERYYTLPSSKQELAMIAHYLPNNNASINLGSNNFIDSSKQTYHLSFQVADLGNAKMAIFIKQLEKTIAETLPSQRFNVVMTGSSIVHFHGTNYLIKNLFESVALAIGLIAFFMAWMFKSKRMVIIALIPNFIPLIMTAAIMGYFSIPLKASTILVFSIAFGISVDDTIHFLAKYRQELKLMSWNIKDSVILALRESGQSMIYTSIILFFGFGIFAASSFGGTAALGILISVTLLFAMCSNLLILPSLLLSFDKFITNRKFKKPAIAIHVDGELDDEDTKEEIKT